jgi:hypothetical protein
MALAHAPHSRDGERLGHYHYSSPETARLKPSRYI